MENEAKIVLDAIQKKINDKVPNDIDKRFSGRVVSLSSGLATVNLVGDVEGNNIVVQNLRELPLIVGQEVSIIAPYGNLSSAYIDWRKAYANDIVYINASTGNDTTGNGTSSYPFATPEKAVSVFDKNLNSRNIVFKVQTNLSGTFRLINFVNGTITIESDTGSNVNVGSIYAYNNFVNITTNKLTATATNTPFDFVSCYGYNQFNSCISTSVSAIYENGIRIDNCGFTDILNCTLSNKYTSGIDIRNGSTAQIKDCTISNNRTGINAFNCSTIFSWNNTGLNTNFGLVSGACSTIGKSSSQPTGSLGNEVVSPESVIR